MILGFAHLADNVANLEEAEARWIAEGYTRIAQYTDVPNHPSKRRFGDAYVPQHDLTLLAGQGLWPIELTRHGTPNGFNTQLTWDRETLGVTVSDPTPFERLLTEGMGFRRGVRDTYAFESRLPTWLCRLRLTAGNTQPVSLDKAGLTCLAFYCSRCGEDVRRLVDLGATECTESFDLTLGDRSMTIAMLRAPGGPLLELITPRSKA